MPALREQRVYEFCRRHARIAYAVKGFDHRDQPLSVKRIDVTPKGKAARYGLDLVRLDSDFFKSWVHQRVLELRLGGAQAAVKKIDALLARAGDGDRVRGAFRYHGAATGRWAGEGFQPQNLKRPVVGDLDAAIAAVSTGDYGSPKGTIKVPTILSVALRSVGKCHEKMPESVRHPEGPEVASLSSRLRAKSDRYQRVSASQAAA